MGFNNSIDVLVNAVATQATQEAASSVSSAVTCAVQQYHPSAAKAWAMLNFAGGSSAAYNVTTVTDTGTGRIGVTLTTAFSSTTYSVVASTRGTINFGKFAALNDATQSESTFELDSYLDTSTLADTNYIYFAAYGDQ